MSAACEVVENTALGKQFFYCRAHKRECNEPGCRDEITPEPDSTTYQQVQGATDARNFTYSFGAIAPKRTSFSREVKMLDQVSMRPGGYSTPKGYRFRIKVRAGVVYELKNRRIVERNTAPLDSVHWAEFSQDGWLEGSLDHSQDWSFYYEEPKAKR